MITLDWDNIAYSEAIRRLRHIMVDKFVQTIELRASPSLDGFHVYITSDNEGGIGKTWRDRRTWQDDGNRLVQDVLAPRAIHRDVMFVYKSSPLGTMNEIPMVKYKRVGNTNEWKCLSLIKPQWQTLSLALQSSPE